MKHGLLLINLGTPANTSTNAVKSYLREFLTDKRVIDLPALLRYVLVYLFILPFRLKRSIHAYRSIWTKQGSPLLSNSQDLVTQVQKLAGTNYQVVLGMRYGQPSIAAALDSLKECESITILPLYPQYSSAASGSAIEETMRILSTWNVIPSVNIIRDFFEHPSYIKAQAALIRDCLTEETHVLFSYHGIPERQIINSGCTSVCMDDCPVLTSKNQGCYKAQCHQSSYFLATELHLSADQYTTAFQSRLGKTPWIKPYTDECLKNLAAQGIKKLTIVCPSFVADCLETLEEIGIRAQQQWLDLGGEQLIVVPCLNAHPLWAKAVTEITRLPPNF